jgi:hypothetical protein
VAGGGVGNHKSANINWVSAKAAADWCDAAANYNGLTAVRSEADFLIASETDLYEAAEMICAGSGVAPAISRGQWFFPYDDPAQAAVIDPLTAAAFKVTDADILDSEDEQEIDGLTFDFKSVETIATDLHILFPDEEAEFDKDSDPVYVPVVGNAPAVRNIRKVEFPAVRRRWQVERVGAQLAYDETNNYRFASFQPNNLRLLPLDPNDVFMFDSVTSGLAATKARIVERTPGGSNLRQEVRVLLLGPVVPRGAASVPAQASSFSFASAAATPAVKPTKAPSSVIIKAEEL